MITLIWCQLAYLAGCRDAARPHALLPGSVAPYAEVTARRAALACARLRRMWLAGNQVLYQRYAAARQEAEHCRAAWAALPPDAEPLRREALRRGLERAEAAERFAGSAGEQAAAVLAQDLAATVHRHAAVIAAYHRGLRRRWPAGTPLPEPAAPPMPDTSKPWPAAAAAAPGTKGVA